MDPTAPGFDPRKFFRGVDADAERGLSLDKYLLALEVYYDRGLLLPGCNVLSEDHLSYLLDGVVGIEEVAPPAGRVLFHRRLLDGRPCHTVKDWQRLDRYLGSYMDLVLAWIPHHRCPPLYSLYNDLLYRGYKYYTECSPAVVQHVKATHPHLANTKWDNTWEGREMGEGEVLLLYHIEQFRRKGGFNVVMATFAEPTPIGIKFFKHLVKFLWMLKPFHDEQIKRDILPQLPGAAFKSQMLNFDTKTLREWSDTDMEDIFKQMRLILQGTCDVERVLLEHGLDFVLKCLAAEILTKRLLGLNWVVAQVRGLVVQPDSLAQLLRTKLADPHVRFFNKLYCHTVMKRQLIDASIPLVQWLDESLLPLFARAVWEGIAQYQLTDASVADALLDLLSDALQWHPASTALADAVWECVQQGTPLPSRRVVALVGALARRSAQSRHPCVQWLWSRVETDDEAIVQLAATPRVLDDRVADLVAACLARGQLAYLRLLAAWLQAAAAGDAAPVVPAEEELERAALRCCQVAATGADAVTLTAELARTRRWPLASPRLSVADVWKACAGHAPRLTAMISAWGALQPRAVLELVLASPTQPVCQTAAALAGLKQLSSKVEETGPPVPALWWLAATCASDAVATDAVDFLLSKQSAADVHNELQRRLRELSSASSSTESSPAVAARLFAITTRFALGSKQPRQPRTLEMAVAAAAPAPSKPLKQLPPVRPDQRQQIVAALDSGFLPDYVPPELRFAVTQLLFERYRWQRFDFWAGDLYDTPNLTFDLIERAREYDVSAYKPAVAPVPTAEQRGAGVHPVDVRAVLAALDLHHNDAELCRAGWTLVLECLDADAVASEPGALHPSDAAWDWSRLCEPSYELLFALEVLGLDTTAAGTKAERCRLFLRGGGFGRLLGVLERLSQRFFESAQPTLCAKQCLTSALNMVYRFMQLPSVDFTALSAREEQLQLSVSSERLVYSAGLDGLPHAMFSLIQHSIAHATDEADEFADYGSLALYLLVSCLVKVPELWKSLALDEPFSARLVAALQANHSLRSRELAAGLLHLAHHHPSARHDLARVLAAHHARVIGAHTPISGSATDIGNAPWLLARLARECVDVLQPNERDALLHATLVHVAATRSCELLCVATALLPPGALDESGTLLVQSVFDMVLDCFLYGSQAASVGPQQREACFGFLEAATAALPPSQLSRALRAVGTRYLQPLPDTFKEDIKALLHTSTSPAAAVKASPPAPYMGIRNLACTCYINATVQQLVNIPSFVRSVVSAKPQAAALPVAAAVAAPEPEPEPAPMPRNVLRTVLARVLADPADEMVRLLFSDSPEMEALKHTTHRGKPALAVLAELGWHDDGSGLLVLPPTVLLDAWERRVGEMAVDGSDCVVTPPPPKPKKPAPVAVVPLAAVVPAVAVPGRVNAAVMFSEFQAMLARLSGSGPLSGVRSYDPQLFVANFPNAQGLPVDPRRQEDACEFFNRLQSQLEQQLAGTPLFDALFGVQEVHSLRCENNHVRLVRPQVATLLPLDFSPNVRQALDAALHRGGGGAERASEWIGGSQCEQCHAAVRVQKRVALEALSDYLVLFVKRYTEELHKIRSPFAIDEVLDMFPYAADAQRERDDPRRWQYELIGLLAHQGGSMHAGHYVSLVRKPDGLWWKFNDTLVTPFGGPLTEERIGAECMMLFYRRVGAKDTQEAEQSAANIANAAGVNAAAFLCDAHALTALPRLVSRVRGDADDVEWVMQLSMRVCFEVLIDNAPDTSATLGGESVAAAWQAALVPLLERSPRAVDWLVAYVVRELLVVPLMRLLHCRDAGARKLFADMLLVCLLQRPAAGPVIMSEVVGLAETSRNYWAQFHEYWDLIARWAESGPAPRAALATGEFAALDGSVRLDFCSLVLDMYLGASSLHYPPGYKRASLGDRSQLNLTRMLDAWAAVMCSMQNPAAVPSPWSLSPGSAPIARDVRALILDNRVEAFMSSFIGQGYNTPAVSMVMRHWSFACVPATRAWLKSAIAALKKYLADPARFGLCRHPVNILMDALSIDDALQASRFTRVFEGTSETPSLFGVLKHDCSPYSALNAEKTIAVLVVVLRRLPTTPALVAYLRDRPALLTHSLSTVHAWLQRSEGQVNEAVLEDASSIVSLHDEWVRTASKQ